MCPETLSREKRSFLMSRVRSKNTQCERSLRAALIRAGLRGFKLHYDVLGKPDFAFPKQKIAIFCDSDFWHGYSPLPSSNMDYWVPKIRGNMKRDADVNASLAALGWHVIRFREKDILRNPSSCLST